MTSARTPLPDGNGVARIANPFTWRCCCMRRVRRQLSELQKSVIGSLATGGMRVAKLLGHRRTHGPRAVRIPRRHLSAGNRRIRLHESRGRRRQEWRIRARLRQRVLPTHRTAVAGTRFRPTTNPSSRPGRLRSRRPRPQRQLSGLSPAAPRHRRFRGLPDAVGQRRRACRCGGQGTSGRQDGRTMA